MTEKEAKELYLQLDEIKEKLAKYEKEQELDRLKDRKQYVGQCFSKMDKDGKFIYYQVIGLPRKNNLYRFPVLKVVADQSIEIVKDFPLLCVSIQSKIENERCSPIRTIDNLNKITNSLFETAFRSTVEALKTKML